MNAHPFARLSDKQLTIEVDRLVTLERNATAVLIAALAEFDRRRLFLPAGFSSLFTYCTQHLHLGEGAAYRRIEAARVCARFPLALTLLADGAITLTTVSLLARHLTSENHVAVLARATHKNKREVEILVAELMPQPDVAASIRKLPRPATIAAPASFPDRVTSTPDTTLFTAGVLASPTAATPNAVVQDTDIGAAGISNPEVVGPRTPGSKAGLVLPLLRPSHRPIVEPLTPERFRLQVTISRETHDTLREIQDLIRHSVPTGDPATIVARALTLLRDQLLRRKTGALLPRTALPKVERRAPRGGDARGVETSRRRAR